MLLTNVFCLSRRPCTLEPVLAKSFVFCYESGFAKKAFSSLVFPHVRTVVDCNPGAEAEGADAREQRKDVHLVAVAVRVLEVGLAFRALQAYRQ